MTNAAYPEILNYLQYYRGTFILNTFFLILLLTTLITIVVVDLKKIKTNKSYFYKLKRDSKPLEFCIVISLMVFTASLYIIFVYNVLLVEVVSFLVIIFFLLSLPFGGKTLIKRIAICVFFTGFIVAYILSYNKDTKELMKHTSVKINVIDITSKEKTQEISISNIEDVTYDSESRTFYIDKNNKTYKLYGCLDLEKTIDKDNYIITLEVEDGSIKALDEIKDK